MGTEVMFTITVYSEQEEVDISYNNVRNTIDRAMFDLLDAADLGMLDWRLDIEVNDWPNE